jgi:hypothetical protein
MFCGISEGVAMQKLWLAYLGLGLAGLAVGQPTRADDPSKVGQRIQKEPAYSSKSPKYCLLGLGPKAETRVWVVLDGGAFYFDHNSNGDLTEPFKRLPIERKLEDKTDDGQTFFTTPQFEMEVTDRQTSRRFDVSFEHSADYREAACTVVIREGKLPRFCEVVMADRPEQAELVHLDGPLSLRLAEPDGPALVRGKEERLLCVQVGTFGRKFAALVETKTVPMDIHPLAEIEFPSKQVGGKPIKVDVVLNRRC